ncbi:MAG: hypothetical protein HKM00_00280 [Gallionella sp.]|jgi:type IV pilus assembly protein PilY1|nr:hypothetical protein [Gallionella sp.]
MKTAYKIIQQSLVQTMLICLAVGQLAQTAQAASADLANVPMAVKNSVTPNLLVTYDNSESMDAFMSGALVAGSDPNTRGNIGRGVMRNAITNFRTVFNWGLMTYGMTGAPGLYPTWAYYLGSDTGMVYTDDCVGYVAGIPAGYPPTPGISASNGSRRCLANPQPFFPGGAFVTYDQSGDDANIQDVLYAPSGYITTPWAVTSGTGTGYYFYSNNSSTNPFNPNFMTGPVYAFGWPAYFNPTDAGFLPSNPPITRQLYLPRAWGYLSNITGYGTINEAVQADSTTHYNNLIDLLMPESNSNSPAPGHILLEVKNGAVFTPLNGVLQSAKTYFSTSYQSQPSPIQYSCQQNFVMMVTDGMPTAKTDGTLYSAADRTNTCTWSTTTNSCTSGSFGLAATEAIAAVTALRTTTNATNTTPYDVQTYVVALGDTVNNANALAVMNAMANAGGTGKALLATDAASFQNSINSITDNITAKVGASAAISLSTPQVTPTDNAFYASRYNSGTWTGDLGACPIDINTGNNACPIDPATGKPVINSLSLWAAGSAQTQLDKLSYPGGTYVPSNASTVRLIATSTDTAGVIGGVQFQPTTATTATKLSVVQQTLLNTPSTTDGAAVVAYLRGDRSGEAAGTYRGRTHLLGDIVNAESLPVRAPNRGYADAGYQGSTTTFKEANASRTRMLYQGANDGMLHAFYAATGAEAWAYIPNLVISNLNNLSNKTGFTHKYLVDGSPVSGDVDFKNCCTVGSGNDWHTILAGGLGKGGRGYYALDVTNPVVANEAAVAGKVLWEFPNSVTNTAQRNAAKLNTGYSFGKPIIVKTQATGWVVLVTSGYNNGTNAGDSGGDGLGHLYVLNPKTGDLLKDIPTPGCTTTPTSSPCGLAQISAYVENTDVDNTTDFVYGGDLMGNVWRFDLTGNSVSGWSVAKFAVLKDAGGVTQPITTTPELAKNIINGIAYRFVYVGTGQYLGSTDVPGTGQNSHAVQTQTMYGLIDSTTSSLPDPLRTTLQAQTLTTTPANPNTSPPTPATRTASSNAVNFATQNGWYVDLPDTGERANTDPVLGSGALVFTTNIPSPTICVPGGSSWEYFLDYKTGGVIPNSTVAWSGTSLGNVLASRPVLFQLPNGTLESSVNTSGGVVIVTKVPVSPGGATGKRISWREIIVQ